MAKNMDLKLRHVAGLCDCGNEPSDPIKLRESLN